MDPAWEPEGELITSPPAIQPTSTTLTGSHILLIPLSMFHVKSLSLSIAGPENGHVWKYVPSGPHLDQESLSAWIQMVLTETPNVMFAIFPTSSHPTYSQASQDEDGKQEQILGICGFSNISAKQRTIEIGMILSPAMQRTTGSTEISYVLLKHCFDDLGYLRVEWKCNNAHEQSKRAALRLGFVQEGLLRRHLIVKGRRRDTAIFSIVKEGWENVGRSLESWLDDSNFKDGKQTRKLEEIRREITGVNT